MKIMKNITADLVCPKDVSARGHLAYEIIMKFLKENDLTYTGGCKVFHSPQEWKERGEQYGTKSHLIVAYDGGNHGQVFSLDHASPHYELYETMQKTLAQHGLYTEECTCWYCAVYDC